MFSKNTVISFHDIPLLHSQKQDKSWHIKEGFDSLKLKSTCLSLEWMRTQSLNYV